MTAEPPRTQRDKVPFLMLLPNMVTLGGMCIGLTSIRFAMDERFGTAMLLLLLAAIFDGVDGLLARSLSATSKIGAELDSLSDFLCFGVAPAILVYQMYLSGIGSLGWVFVLVFASATCLRLARFNVHNTSQEEDAKPMTYFIGVPAPGGALLVLFPAFLDYAEILSFGDLPYVVAIWSVIVALLMVSGVQTLSPKALRVPRALIWPMMFTVVIAIGLLFTRPWLVLVIVDTVYSASLIRSLYLAARRHRG
ncbi:CDP-diacylglycerol--serine O-phosphatidyltransferase [Primorskyibacter aestuariivivens]|uniref:CDP-diacylglycerol--serine O-phosphatidyltransferase n=1 Tax=Primorskyibacter aestuariivivens TaxID=1888912 RepID=UPI00230145A0|nr:CDP-diacylglycerol--serine O-phosphatidyltransferase [Primorskyibacter aestuariivivens]MDA7427779.1 CDP-diacylglycerol--serine O-phosphatidyltransferase [Primorskyibacter aestuariivivens]